jgi:hypothetical protein
MSSDDSTMAATRAFSSEARRFSVTSRKTEDDAGHAPALGEDRGRTVVDRGLPAVSGDEHRMVRQAHRAITGRDPPLGLGPCASGGAVSAAGESGSGAGRLINQSFDPATVVDPLADRVLEGRGNGGANLLASRAGRERDSRMLLALLAAAGGLATGAVMQYERAAEKEFAGEELSGAGTRVWYRARAWVTGSHGVSCSDGGIIRQYRQ